MLSAYYIILCLSAAIGSWSALRIARRLETMVNSFVLPSGLFAIVSVLSFFMIISVPAAVLIAALFLLALGWLAQRRSLVYWMKVAAPVLAVGLGFIDTVFGPNSIAIPLAAALGAGWLAISFTGYRSPDLTRPALLFYAALLAPLIAAPFFTDAPDYLALDGALILSAVAGATFAQRGSGALGLVCRLPLAYLIGWMLSIAAMHHAYIPLGISAAVALMGVALSFTSRRATPAHAPAL